MTLDLSRAIREEVASYDDTSWTGMLGSTEVTIYARPLTPANMSRIERRHPGFSQSPTTEGMVDLLIETARDEHGAPAFSKKHKSILMRFSTDKIGEIFSGLFSEQMDTYDDEDFEEDLKN